MENNKQKSTTYQLLNNFFNQGDNIVIPQQTNTQERERKIIITGNSPEDIRKKALEIEQKQKLQQKFFNVTERGYQKAMQYEAARLPAYMDYESMEHYPIIASALDLFMEEATTIGFNGKMLNIHSSKDRIKFLLEEFFYDIINVNINLPFWIRNFCKYGDNFVLMYGEKKKGITHVKQMVNYEIDRIEKINKGKSSVLFKNRLLSDEYNPFEVAHFRLLGDDKFLPYGSSVLSKVRRVFRQLIMGEDAILTYRITRAGEKKVFKIDVGNIDENDVESYMTTIASTFKRTQQVQNNGQFDYRFNILGVDEDYFIPVRNANVQTGIDTLPGASNLNEIADIEYFRDNLFVGLGIPKPFLSFQDASGAGKNMAQYDIRFAKKVNRIQQCAIQELNKMAIVHLLLLGYDETDVKDFELTLTNPSTQQDTLKTELLKEKAGAYGELTNTNNGIAAISHTQAKKLVWGWSDAEIINDLRQQKMERTVIQEMQDSPVVIKKSGIFSDIDKRYGEPIDGGIIPEIPSNGQENQQQVGGGAGQDNVNLGGEQPTTTNEVPPTPPSGGAETPTAPLQETNFDEYLKLLVMGDSKKEEIDNNVNKKMLIENSKLNSLSDNMVLEINQLLDKAENINNNIDDEDVE